MTLDNLNARPWLMDTFPDMLWYCAVLTAHDDEVLGLRICAETLDVIDDALASADSDLFDDPRFVMDGQLTTIEQIPHNIRDAILQELERIGLFEFAVSEDFAHAIGTYPSAPGRWLIQPWLQRGLYIDWEVAQRFLSTVVSESAHGQDRIPTRAKALVTARWFKADKLRIYRNSGFPFELLKGYPNLLTNPEIERADASIRALFLSLESMKHDGVDDPASIQWARDFWRSNWRIYPCWTENDSNSDGANGGSITEVQSSRLSMIDELHESFLTLAHQADPDLYSPDRYEVLTGIVLRALRLARAAASTPILWSGEHGFPIVRSLVEALIVFRWLIKRDDPGMYTKFKEYGRGRLKLLKLHLEEYIESLDDPSDELREALEYIDAEVNQDTFEEWQEISIDSTFSGANARKMAIDVGMEQEYRLLFQPASAVAHGEWSTLDRYVLQRCLNPLHAGHRVPRTSLTTMIGPELLHTGYSLVADLVTEYKEAVNADTIDSAGQDS